MAGRFSLRGRRWRLALVVSLAVTAFGSVFLVSSSGAEAPNGVFLLHYTAKYACVPEVGPAGAMFIPQAAGAGALQYRTVINVHNPQPFNVQITKKAAGARTEFEPPGVIGGIKFLTLLPDQVLAINCVDIVTLLGGVQPNGDRIVEVTSPNSLDVWAVYTMRGSSAAGLNGNIDVVQVPEQQNH